MSFHLMTVRDIPIRLHVTLAFVFALLVAQLGLWGLPAGVILFGSVLLHELGHAVVAQEHGLPISRIDLHLLGGTASMTRPPRTPREEILIAAAGPAVSFALAVGFFVLSMAFGGSLSLGMAGPADLFAYGSLINLMLGLFNLVPALPMDGGRIFRAALSARFGALRGTQIAAKVSRVFGGIFIGVALLSGSLSLGLIGGLLFFLAGQEQRMAEQQAAARYATGPSLHVPFGPWSPRYGAGRPSAPPPEMVVVNAG
ncbi:MAG: site-2 protease family protein, partial [Myxococcota bacterium]